LLLPGKHTGEDLVRCVRSSIQLVESLADDDKHRYIHHIALDKAVIYGIYKPGNQGTIKTHHVDQLHSW